MPSRCPLCNREAFDVSRYDGYYCYPRLDGCGMSSPINIGYHSDILSFTISKNNFINKDIEGYAHGLYIPYKSSYKTHLTDLILGIKGKNGLDIENIVNEVSNKVKFDLDLLISTIEKYKKNRPIVVVMARSKPDNFWKEHQLKFRMSVATAIKNSSIRVKTSGEPWVLDGVDYIKRVKETKTTHLAHCNLPENSGPEPYPGITNDTCVLNGNISGKHIILIDDIYTANVGVDEDCIQFLYDRGANDVTLYVLGITIKPPRNDQDLEILF